MIRLPNAILGNPDILVTMGKKAELIGLFYPRRDHAQHVEESIVCFHDGQRLLWTNNQEWKAEQQYLEDTNIVSTQLCHDSGLKLNSMDLVHPDHPILIRRLRISCDRDFKGKLFYYSKLNVGDSHKKNSAFCDPENNILLQYWQDYYIGLKAIPDFKEWQVGKAIDTIWWTNAKYDMEDGKLQNVREDIGNINTAVGWDLDISQDKNAEITILIGASNRRDVLYRRMREIIAHPVDNIVDKAKEDSAMWLSRKKYLQIFKTKAQHPLHKELFNVYNRALLTLDLLTDPYNGACIAAPEFDPNFEMCGGYGFCWNRDAAEVMISLLNAGYPEYCRRFLEWCKGSQLSDGSWFQRYWLDGKMGPSWGNFYNSTQIDETGSTIHAIGNYYRTLEGPDRMDFLEDMWVTILRGAEYLMKRTENGLHDPCMDLWETYSGTFSYTNAAVYAGLVAAFDLAEGYNEPELAKRWLERAKTLKERTKEKMWLREGYFAKGIIDGQLITDIDASILGTFVPFNMLSPKNHSERAMIYSIIDSIEKKLRHQVNGHYGIKRYESDNYIEGNPWVVTTLWLSKAMLELANSLKNENEQMSEQLVRRALDYIKWTLEGTTNTGLLPEQVDKNKGHAVWAIPLGWSCGLFIDNVLLLNEWEFG